MRRSRIIIASAGLAVAAAIGGVTAAAATGSPTRAATVHTARAVVTGKTETILVNAQGRPLYYYRPDTAATSLVNGGLARLWPPLTSAAPTAAGVTAKLTVVKDSNGNQVAYNGHLLYTFVSDPAGKVTGQGFQNFFVATPGLAALANSRAPGTTTPPGPASGYGY
jgi:predicted lipoprotein with Yx(FWY)xxD motif